jgi:hypothetical protein
MKPEASMTPPSRPTIVSAVWPRLSSSTFHWLSIHRWHQLSLRLREQLTRPWCILLKAEEEMLRHGLGRTLGMG